MPTDENKSSVGVQAAVEYREKPGYLPARRRSVPVKFKDYQDLDQLHEDPTDMDGSPAVAVKYKLLKTGKHRLIEGSKRGRPREKHDDDGQASDAKKQILVSKEPANPETSTLTEETKLKADNSKYTSEMVSKRKRPPGISSRNHPKTFRCLMCNKSFSQKGNLKVHMMYHNDERPFPCDVETCSKSFRTKENLRRHKMSHDGIKEFQCAVCKASFASQVSVKEHMARHTNTKDYHCSICGQQFRQVSCLRRHQRTHSDLKTHRCDVCGSMFSQTVYLKSHMKKHTGERPFHCKTCDKKFAHLSDLNRHKSVHTGEKKHTCEVCGAKFSDPSSKRRHVKEHSGFKPFSCQICGDTFKRSGNLKSHLAKKHRKCLQRTSLIAADLTSALEQKRILVVSEPNLMQFHPEHPSKDVYQPTQVVLQDAITSLDQQLETATSLDSLVSVQNAQSSEDQQTIKTVNSQTQKILDHIRTEVSSLDESVVDSQGRPLQVCYQVIHDDEDQQIVEIQYLPATQQQGQELQTQDTSPEISESEQLAEKDSQEEESNSQSVDQLETEGRHQGQLDSEDHHYQLAVLPTMKEETQRSRLELSDQSSQLQSIGSCTSQYASVDFLHNPDFSSQSYYNWLSHFTEVCKFMALPLDTAVFTNISQVHKTLSDVLAAPSGILTNAANFKSLMDISKELNCVITEHLTHVLKTLEDN